MAKSKRTIDLNYNNAIKQADELDRLSRDIKRLKSVLDARSNISSFWQATCTENYKSALNREIKNLDVLSDNYKVVASIIRDTAEEVYKAEMDALRIAKDRQYSGGGSR